MPYTAEIKIFLSGLGEGEEADRGRDEHSCRRAYILVFISHMYSLIDPRGRHTCPSVGLSEQLPPLPDVDIKGWLRRAIKAATGEPCRKQRGLTAFFSSWRPDLPRLLARLPLNRFVRAHDPSPDPLFAHASFGPLALSSPPSCPLDHQHPPRPPMHTSSHAASPACTRLSISPSAPPCQIGDLAKGAGIAAQNSLIYRLVGTLLNREIWGCGEGRNHFPRGGQLPPRVATCCCCFDCGNAV